MTSMGSAPPILLLSDAVAVVAIVCVFGLALVMIVVVALLFQGQHRSGAAAPTYAAAAVPAAASVRLTRPRAGAPHLQPMEIDVPTKHVDQVIGALQAAGWRVEETGEVVATDDDEEALTTLSVQMPVAQPTAAAAMGTGEEIR